MYGFHCSTELTRCELTLRTNVCGWYCRLDEEGVVKVGDFGMARDVYSHLYYRGDKHSEIPVKWSAPETLTDGLSTVMSDVVSICLTQVYLHVN